MPSQHYRALQRLGLLILATSTLLLGSVHASQTDRPTLAVLDFEGFGLSEPEVAILTNRFRANLAQLGPYTIIERGLMEEILLEQNFQMTGCTTNECVVSVGRMLGVQFMLAGSIGKIGSTWTIEMRVVNVETGAIEKTAFYDVQGAIDLMLTEGMEIAAQRIVNVESTTSAVHTPVTTEITDTSTAPTPAIAEVTDISTTPTPVPVEVTDASTTPTMNTVEMPYKLTASDAQAGDLFGGSVAISSDYAITGAINEDTGGSNAGAAYVFRRMGANSWDAGTKLTARDAQAGDLFGGSVAISGDYAIIGAIFEDTRGDAAGAAYVFQCTGANSWDNGSKLTAPDAQAGDYFGISIAISGEYAIVGATGEDAGGDDAGAAYVYQRIGTNSWDNGTKLTASDAQAGDLFGFSVALSSDYAIVGAQLEDDGGDNAGAVYIFRRTGTNSWDSGTKLTAPDAQAGDYFGSTIALSGDYVIVGATDEDAGGSSAGAAYVFQRIGTNSWDDGTKLNAPNARAGDLFGGSVAISGDYTIVGAKYGDAGINATGTAYLFQHIGTNNWEYDMKLTTPNVQAGDLFSYSVALSGNYAIVGAREDNAGGDAAGAAYIFEIE